MPTFTIDGNEVEVPEGMSQKEATKIFQASQAEGELQEKISSLPPGTGGEGVPMTQQEQSDLPVDLLRTGVPLLAAFATRGQSTLAGAGKLALITGMSELAANELTERYENPDYQNGMDFMARKAKNATAAATSAGASFVGDRFLLPWMSKHVNKLKNFTSRRIARRAGGRMGLVPQGGLTKEVATAQRFLGERKFLRGEPKTFSLTMDQIHQGQKTFIEEMGSLTRSGMLSGKVMRASDIANIDVVNEFVENLMRSGPDVTPQQFGNMLSMLFNRDKSFVKAYTNASYDQFRKATYNRGIEVNLSDAFEYLRENADNRFARKIASKVFRSDPAVVRSLKNGEEMMSWSDDQLEQFFGNIPPEEMRALMDQISGSVPLETAADMYHNLNLVFGKSKAGGIGHFTSGFKKRMDNALETSLEAIEGSYGQFQAANAFARKHGERMEKQIIEGIFKKIGDEKPASIVHLFKGSQGPDSYKAVERFFRTSDKLTMPDFDKAVRAPLRHRFLSQVFDENTGKFGGASLDRALKMTEKRGGPEFLDDLFSPQARKSLHEAANTLKVLEGTRESNIIIKMIQASVLMGGASAIAVGDAVDSNTIQRIGMGAVAVGLIPLAMARIMANPRLMRTLTDGMVARPGTSKFARAVMVAVVQNRQALKDMGKMSPEAQDFYDNPYKDVPEDQVTQAAPPMRLGDLPGTAGEFFPEQPLQ